MSPAAPRPPALEIHDLRRGFREGGRTREVLAGVDLTVAAGERVALLGPSGSGKSTLLNCIAGIDLPDTGVVRVGGVDLTALDERARTLFRRTQVGFVFQFFNLIPTLTVEENVLLPVELRREGPDGRLHGLRLLSAVGLGDRGGAYPDRLSGGEQQRVALARALAHRPRLVLADEPTGNLDASTGSRVLDLLEGLTAESGATLLLVTHSQRVAGRCDRVLELVDGRLSASSPRGEPESVP